MAGDELKAPREGFTMIGVSFTKDAMKNAIAEVKKLHADGWAEAKVIGLLRKDLPSFSDHTLRRIYDLALGRPVKDDFAKDDLASQRAAAKDTFELELKAERSDLKSGGIVRFLGSDWYIKRISGVRLMIRRLM